MNISTCDNCGWGNPRGDLACRRCGGMLGLPSPKSLSQGKTTLPRYLFLLPFLLLALGYACWIGLVTKSANDAMHPEKQVWDHPAPPKPRNLADDPKIKAAMEQSRKEMDAWVESTKHPYQPPPQPNPYQPTQANQPTQATPDQPPPPQAPPYRPDRPAPAKQ